MANFFIIRLDTHPDETDTRDTRPKKKIIQIL